MNNDPCYSRFFFSTDSRENHRRITSWLFRTFNVYKFVNLDNGLKGMFVSTKPLTREPWRRMTDSLPADPSLRIRIIAYDLTTIYVEGYFYHGRWFSRTL